MCPLRIILIFLSATLAGFFVLRNLKSSPSDLLDSDSDTEEKNSPKESPVSAPVSAKICGAVVNGFWTCVDMASGRYLWRNLVGSEASSSKRVL